MDNFVLPIGLMYKDYKIIELPIAPTGGEAEKIYTKKPTATNLYTWFGKVITVSVGTVAGESLADTFIKQADDKKEIPQLVKKIPLLDVGALLIQIQRECWEDVIGNQRVQCVHCGQVHNATIDLNRIEMPNTENPDKEVESEYLVDLKRVYTIQSDIEQMAEYNGMKFNKIKFRTPTLEDALKHENVSKDEIIFWQNIAFDCIKGLVYEVEDEEYAEVPSSYIARRGKQLFSKDFNSKTLKAIRLGLQTGQPTAKSFYEEECPNCGKDTPFFASIGSFFMV